jgi:predicted phage terminase large subunit-like protein
MGDLYQIFSFKKEIFEAVELEKSLKKFIQAAWHIVEPATEYKHNWHIDAICEHLEAVTNGEIRNLLINMPPRAAKSTCVSVMWPVWMWTFKPEARFLCASYAQSLSIRDNLKCRRLIESNWYKERFGDVFELTGDQNTKTRFEKNKTGYRLATSVDSAATGEGGDFLIVDDPVSATEAASAAVTQHTQDWFDNTFSTRLNDPATGAKVIVMQRLNENDLSAHILRQGGYEHLLLPMEFEEERRASTSIGWTDPRKKDGELLWPERFTPDVLEDFKLRLGSYGYAGQMQQRPAPREGGFFQKTWFETTRAAPGKAKRVRAWDRAASIAKKGTDPDWTVGLKLVRDEHGCFYIEDVVRFRGSSLDVQKAIRNTAEQDGKNVKIILEQDPGQAGKSEVEYLIRMMSGFSVKAVPIKKDKVTRASPVSAQAEAGNIKIVRGDWNHAFLEELCAFPNAKHDDTVDALSTAFDALSNYGFNYSGLIKM